MLRGKLLIILMFCVSFIFGQNNPPIDSLPTQKDNLIKNRHTLGSSFFMLGNFLSDSPDYYLLTYWYRLTKKDRFFVEFNTWKYSEPKGTYGKSKEFYPGYVRAFAVRLGYQRFHWKGLFTALQASPFIKQDYNTDNDKIQKGFQLYLQAITGYRFEFFKKRWYLEPALALKYWPINANYPTDFKEIEKGSPKYIFEPSLNLGFKF